MEKTFIILKIITKSFNLKAKKLNKFKKKNVKEVLNKTEVQKQKPFKVAMNYFIKVFCFKRQKRIEQGKLRNKQRYKTNWSLGKNLLLNVNNLNVITTVWSSVSNEPMRGGLNW